MIESEPHSQRKFKSELEVLFNSEKNKISKTSLLKKEKTYLENRLVEATSFSAASLQKLIDIRTKNNHRSS